MLFQGAESSSSPFSFSSLLSVPCLPHYAIPWKRVMEMIVTILKNATAVGIDFPSVYIYSILSSPSSIPLANLVSKKMS